MHADLNAKLLVHLLDIINDDRCHLLRQVVDQRTRYLTVVLENIYQPQNASAVLRTMECLGIQDLHVIENDNAYRVNPDVVRGASKWITLNRYNDHPQGNTKQCLNHLKDKGYKIAAMTLHEDSISLEALPLQEKLAICFGEEETGLSDIAHEMADYYVHIPMVGFTQSLNLSVSAGITISHLYQALKNASINWKLSQEEKQDLMIDWLVKSTPTGESIKKLFLEKHLHNE
jgi:tRNA (guanosine-2'-O-)-methyltransferase